MNGRLRFVLALALLVGPFPLAAQEVRRLDAVEVLFFEHGYRVLAAPALAAEVKKTVALPEEVNIAGWLDTAEGRFYLSDWSLERRQRGESHFWIVSNPPMADAGGDWRDRFTVFAEPVELAAGLGFRVFAEPRLDATVLKTTEEAATFEVAGSVVNDGVTFYVSAWSMERFRSGAAATLNWVLPFGVAAGAMPQGAAPTAARPAPRPDRIEELWSLLWDEQTTRYAIIETARELLPLLAAKDGATAPRTLAVEITLGLAELESGQRAPGRMRVDRAAPGLLAWFRERGGAVPANDSSETYALDWGMGYRASGDAVKALLLCGRPAEARVLRDSYGADWRPRDRLLDLALRIDEGADPAGTEISALVGELEEYDRENALRLLEERGFEKTAAVWAKGWGLWSRGLRDDPEALRRLAEQASDDSWAKARSLAKQALALQALGQPSPAESLWEQAMEETTWTIDLALEHVDLYAGVPDAFGLARDLGVPEAFLETALEKTVEVLRRTSNRILTDDYASLGADAETFLEVELPARAGSARYTAEAAIAVKGCVLERALFARRLDAMRHDASCADLVSQLDALVKEYRESDADFGTESDPGLAFDGRIAALLEELAARTGDPSLRLRGHLVTSRQVEAVLPAEVALVEFVKYSRGYAAVVLRRDTVPVFLDLADAKTIEALVEDLRGSLLPAPGDTRGEEELDRAFRDSSSRLHDLIVVPLEAAGGGAVAEWVLCPEGDLHFLPFAALLGGDGRFWCEGVPLTFVDSGRNLVKLAAPAATDRSAVLFGDPVFRLEEAGGSDSEVRSLRAGLRQGACIDAATLVEGLDRLPGTREEVESLNTTLAAAGYAVEVWTGEAATEGRLKQVRSPGLLHLATHGFCFPGLLAGGRGAAAGVVTDPMVLSSLALTGACETYGQWAESGRVPEGDDGIVLAREIAGLPLRGTELVVLSACETGLGLSTRNHGVQGLKTALMMGGARNVLLSLWPVSDEATVEFMRAFYKRYAAGATPASASHQAQVEMLARLRGEGVGDRERAALASPFVLTVGESPWR